MYSFTLPYCNCTQIKKVKTWNYTNTNFAEPKANLVISTNYDYVDTDGSQSSTIKIVSIKFLWYNVEKIGIMTKWG